MADSNASLFLSALGLAISPAGFFDIDKDTKFNNLSDESKKQAATVAALELIRSYARHIDSGSLNLEKNLNNLEEYRDQILKALGENVQ